jgi:hypothetical protein
MKKCPLCKSTKGVRVYLYGMPAEEPDPAKFAIGGCLGMEDGPDYICTLCSTEFYKNSAKHQSRFLSDGSGVNFKCPDCDEWFQANGKSFNHNCWAT